MARLKGLGLFVKLGDSVHRSCCALSLAADDSIKVILILCSLISTTIFHQVKNCNRDTPSPVWAAGVFLQVNRFHAYSDGHISSRQI
jgi:hypothetical protein